jgi:hypothetical protein
MSNGETTNQGQTDDPTASEEASGRPFRVRLATLRRSTRERRLLTLVGLVVGVVAALSHWLGFVLGGALVALPQISLRRGLVAGLGFGVFGWLVFLTFLGTDGVLNIYVQMTPVLIVSTATALLGGLLGSMIRGVV